MFDRDKARKRALRKRYLSRTAILEIAANPAAWLGWLVAFAAILFSVSLAHALPGNVDAEQKISDTDGSFTGTLDDSDFFGWSVGSCGDLDGDTVPDIVVGAIGDDDGGSARGAVWVLFMTSSGTVSSHQKISDNTGGFGGGLGDGDQLGSAVAGIGDLDGDGVGDIAVGAMGDDDGGTDRGAVYILLMNANGTVKSKQKISDTSGGFGGTLDNSDMFGASIAGPGDIDGDGIEDIVVGATGDDDGGTDRGAVWVLFLDTDGTVQGDAKISDLTAGLAGSLSDSDFFGTSITAWRDLNNDGVEDIAVGAIGDDDGGSDRGAVYVIFLTAAGAIDSAQKISDLAGGFNGTLGDGDAFGTAVTVTTDLNNNDIDELIVGAPGDDAGGSNRGQLWVLFVDTAGMVTLHRQISDTLGGFGGTLDDNDRFGSSVVSPRDVDADQIADLVTGAINDDDGGTNRGAAWVLLLDGTPGAFCGDGILDPGEECDDGNEDNGDCCSSSCTYETAGSPCPNATVCDGEETCDGAGVCGAGTPLNCDDGMPCTQDTCDDISGCQSSTGPATGCFLAAKNNIDVKNKDNNNADQFKWKFQKGDEVLFTDLGDPTTSTVYSVCLFDEVAESPTNVMSIAVPAGAAWQMAGNQKGFKYKDSTAFNGGVKQMLLKVGDAGKSKLQVVAKGVNLSLPAPIGMNQYFSQGTSVIVQLLSDTGECWESEFTAPADKNDGERFKDK